MVDVNNRQEPIKQARYVFICTPPPNDRIGMKIRKKKRHSGNIFRKIAMIILHRVLRENSKKHIVCFSNPFYNCNKINWKLEEEECSFK